MPVQRHNSLTSGSATGIFNRRFCIRELKAQITREGFVYLPKRGQGTHERWRHPLLKKTLTIPVKDGDDVPLYLEKQLAKLLTELEDLR